MLLSHSTGHLSHSTGHLSHSTGQLSNSTGQLSHSTGQLANSTGQLSHSAGQLSHNTFYRNTKASKIHDHYRQIRTTKTQHQHRLIIHFPSRSKVMATKVHWPTRSNTVIIERRRSYRDMAYIAIVISQTYCILPMVVQIPIKARTSHGKHYQQQSKRKRK